MYVVDRVKSQIEKQGKYGKRTRILIILSLLECRQVVDRKVSFLPFGWAALRVGSLSSLLAMILFGLLILRLRRRCRRQSAVGFLSLRSRLRLQPSAPPSLDLSPLIQSRVTLVHAQTAVLTSRGRTATPPKRVLPSRRLSFPGRAERACRLLRVGLLGHLQLSWIVNIMVLHRLFC